jgi:hypothetical protein
MVAAVLPRGLQSSSERFVTTGGTCRCAAHAVVSEARRGADRLDAYFHPFGFVHVNLGMVRGAKLRLHVWPSGETAYQKPEWLIHNHHFAFRSTVLTGQLGDSRYVVTPTHVVPRRNGGRLFTVHRDRGHCVLKATSEVVRIVETETHRFVAGMQYLFKAGDYHDSRKLGPALAATLLIAQVDGRAGSYVVGGVRGASTIRRANVNITVDALHQLLCEVEQAM